MSFEASVAFTEQYKANVTILLQQKGSRLRPAVMHEAITGRHAYVEQIGPVKAQRVTTRHGDSPLISTPHGRRRLTPFDYEWGDLIDDLDKVKMLIDPTSPYAMNAANAMGRGIDEEIITALGGTAYTGEDGTTPVALPAGQKLAEAASGLTVAKLRAARRTLLAANVDPSEQFFLAVTAQQLDDLLADTTVTSADFNTVKALVSGELDTFMGFKFLHTELLPKEASTRRLYAWAKTGVALGVGKDITGRITERPDKRFSTYVYYCMSVGATRLEEQKVVEIACQEP
ncbi:MAG: phage capsid protein [Inquilinaceae bacterium]